MAMPRGESRDEMEEGAGYLPSISDASADGAAGAMASDSISLARWWRAFCAGEIVSEASLTVMSTLHDNDHGLGLSIPRQGTRRASGTLVRTSATTRDQGAFPEDQLIMVVLHAPTSEDDSILQRGRPLVLAARSN